MPRERDGSTVLIDFGAARQQMGRQSRSITAVLTPGYPPIEQYSAKGRQGPWTDVYALGALAYAALSGRAPEDATERMLEDRLEPLASASAVPVSAGMCRAVEAGLAADLRWRPQDTGQWLALLGEERASGDEGVAGRVAAVPAGDSGSGSWKASEEKSPAPVPAKVVAPSGSGGPARRGRRRVSSVAVGGAARGCLSGRWRSRSWGGQGIPPWTGRRLRRLWGWTWRTGFWCSGDWWSFAVGRDSGGSVVGGAAGAGHAVGGG